MNILGDTLEKIASEKAGIIKPTIPVVIGEYLPETKPVFISKAAQCNSAIYFAAEEYTFADITLSSQNLQCSVTDTTQHIKENFTLDLNGIYQTKNLRTVLCAEKFLMKMGFVIPDAAEKYALSNTKKLTGLHGRWDVIAENPTIVMDVAHNEDGIKQVVEQIQFIKAHGNSIDIKIHFIIGMVKDKEVFNVLSLLPNDAAYYFTNAHIPRALPAEELKIKAAAFNLKGDFFGNVNDAITAAKKNAYEKDLIIICGSVFLVGEVN
jgi:dihydrofolate synthase/folylpolyglutamate synthase